MKPSNDWGNNAPISITPSGFFGNSSSNIIEIKDFLSLAERERLMDFALNNKIWDITETHRDADGLVLYDHKIWEDRVCTYNSLMASDPGILELIYSMIDRLKIEVDAFFSVDAKETGPAIVRWPIGARQEPHADKEFHTGPEKGRPNDFPWYDLAGLFYFNDDYEGGAFVMFQDEVVELKQGDLMIFPSVFLFPHRVEPVTKGIRHTFVSWSW